MRQAGLFNPACLFRLGRSSTAIRRTKPSAVWWTGPTTGSPCPDRAAGAGHDDIRRLTLPLLLAAGLALAGCGGAVPASAPTTAPSAMNPITANPALSAAITAEPEPSGPRPANGAVITKRGAAGRGQLAVENGTGKDALLTLSRDGRAVYAVYVRASGTTELTGVADGDYEMFVAQGDGWNAELHRLPVRRTTRSSRTPRRSRPCARPTDPLHAAAHHAAARRRRRGGHRARRPGVLSGLTPCAVAAPVVPWPDRLPLRPS